MELRQAVRGVLDVKGASNKEIDSMFELFDADKSGAIDLMELKP